MTRRDALVAPARGTFASATARRRGCAPSIANPKPATSSSSTSFSPSPNATIAVEVEPELARRRTRAPSPSTRRDSPSRAGTAATRQEDAARRSAPRVAPRMAARTLGLGDRDDLRRRAVEPLEEVADLGHGEVLEAGVRARVLRLRGDVELVVDVDVRRDAERTRAARSPRGRPRARAARGGGTRRSRVDHGGALVADDRLGDPGGLEVRAAPSGTSALSRSARGSRPRATARSRRACARRAARRFSISVPSRSHANAATSPRETVGEEAQPPVDDDDELRPRRRSAAPRAGRRTSASRPGRASRA